ncbi:membrane protein insertion efficiency factor YidD [Pseudokineococcus sp. 5B2Z-1]|uniref:membrane protein insertion efficiency factor YidD n=1 Tax=Pseudokineococcus sp. 5B2Z-1 TaxID=3132744 RepID=UPI0030A2447B
MSAPVDEGARAGTDGSSAPRGGAARGVADPRTWPRRLLVLLVRVWQLVVSPWYPPVCRFYPSCSAYAVQALDRHGAARGGWLAARRLLRCHPWNPGGVDHVPPVGGRAEAPPHGARPA